MARGAKIFGFRCIFGALLEMLLAGILLVATDGGSSTTDPSSDLPISPELGGVAGGADRAAGARRLLRPLRGP